MPEGDSIRRVAARLRPVLEGRPLERFAARLRSGARPRPGETIGPIEAWGKHLLIPFSGGLTLDTHLGMSGSWRVVAVGAGPGRDAHLVRVHLGVADADVFCLAAPTVRTFPTAATDDRLGHLAGDLSAADVDLDAAVGRWADLHGEDTPLLDVLLDQRIATGVGNVYASEVCWHTRHHPLVASAALDPGERRSVLGTASRLLRANLRPGARRTVAGGLAAYGRRGRPCRRCGTPITSGRLGRMQRVTYWCPHCQPAPGTAADGYPHRP